MAYLPGDAREFDITQWKGSAQAVDPYALDPSHGLYSQNVDFVVSPGGEVYPIGRRGASQIAQLPSTDGAALSLFNWYFNNAGVQDCWAVYYSSANGAKAWKQTAQAFTSLVATTGAKYMSFATDGIRGYFGFSDATGRYGTAGGSVYNASTAASDGLFPPPITQGGSAGNISFSVNTAAGSGVITAGTHRIGFIYTTRNGAVGPICPVTSALAFAQTSATAADGTHSWAVTITFVTAPPTYLQGGSVQIVMSSAANQAQYFAVAGTITPISASTTYVIPVNIADGDLVTGTDVTLYQNYLTQSLAGSPPFKPSAIFPFSNRMGYVTLDSAGFPVVYFSEVNGYQQINAGIAGVYLEGRQIPVHGVSIDSICYIATLSALYACSDNGRDPATWSSPKRVDGSVGVLAPSCIISSAGRLLLASEKGLFSYRGGAFPQIPLSYYDSDWNRINWANPTQIVVNDDALDRVIRVVAPLQVVVTGATNTNPITITTGIKIGANVIAYPHLFQTGLSVTITGVGGNTAANTTQAITVTGANTFTIPVAGNGTYTGGGVAAPNSPNAEMSWNYSLGETADALLYSLNGWASFRPGTSGVIRNISTNQDEVWYAAGGSNPGPLIRRVLPSDVLLHRDVDMSGNPAAIDSRYETGIVPGQTPDANLHDYQGAHLRASGNGQMALIAYGLDHVRSVVPAASPLTLTGGPGIEVLLKWWLRSEQQTVTFSTNAVDAFFQLVYAKMYWLPGPPIR